jgi:hypothetical protein
VSCYAFLKGWLLPSLPPGCLHLLTSFLTEVGLRDLKVYSGLFPFRPRTLAPKVCLPMLKTGIRSFPGCGKSHPPPSPMSALPPAVAHERSTSIDFAEN